MHECWGWDKVCVELTVEDDYDKEDLEVCVCSQCQTDDHTVCQSWLTLTAIHTIATHL